MEPREPLLLRALPPETTRARWSFQLLSGAPELWLGEMREGETLNSLFLRALGPEQFEALQDNLQDLRASSSVTAPFQLQLKSASPALPDLQLLLLPSPHIVDIHITALSSDAVFHEGFFRKVVETVNDGILVNDPQGKILFLNDNLAGILGYSPAQLLGRHLFDLMDEEGIALTRHRLANRKRGEEEIFDFRFVHKRGHDVWVLVSAKPLYDLNGEHLGSLVAITDISKRKQAEQQVQTLLVELEQRVEERTQALRTTNLELLQEIRERKRAEEEAARASQAKSVFLANMSHELRTPLNAIIGYAEMLEEDLLALQVEQCLPDIHNIQQAGRHLLALISDILDLSKIEAGKVQLVLEEISLPEFLKGVADTLGELCRKHRNLFSWHMEPGLHVLQTDLLKLRQILYNLLSNAAKFTRDGSIALRVASLQTAEGRPGIVFEVEDTGIGIASEKLAGIFQPFEQGDASTTRRFGGAGLGLAISSEFARLLGGTLRAQSTPGVGSVFSLHLPLRTDVSEPTKERNMSKVMSDDQVEIHYRVVQAQEPGGPTLLLVHGWMVSGAVFDALLPHLSGFRLIIPDHRGAGLSGSSPSGYTLERYAADVLAVADDAGAQQFLLLGHSMGGQIAQRVAATAPERVQGLILLNTVPASGIPLPDEAVQLFRNSGQHRDSQATILDMACKLLTDEAKEALLNDAGKISKACIEGAFDAWTRGGFEDELGSITAPTLVVATDDPFLPPDFLTQAVVNPIPRARLAHLPGPGHYPHVEKTAETAALLHAFVAGVGA